MEKNIIFIATIVVLVIIGLFQSHIIVKKTETIKGYVNLTNEATRYLVKCRDEKEGLYKIEILNDPVGGYVDCGGGTDRICLSTGVE